MSDPNLTMVVAVARNGVIGRDGGMPWHLRSDLQHFKALTLGKPVIMGRKTFASIGKPLPGRVNIVVTRDGSFRADGVLVAENLPLAIDTARREAHMQGVGEICIIGGGEIYRQAMALADILHVTEIDADVDGDTRFPPIDPDVFEKIADVPQPQGEHDSHAMRFTTWRRKS